MQEQIGRWLSMRDVIGGKIWPVKKSASPVRPRPPRSTGAAGIDARHAAERETIFRVLIGVQFCPLTGEIGVQICPLPVVVHPPFHLVSMGGQAGMICVGTIGMVRRYYLVEKKSIKEICRVLNLSRERGSAR